MQTQKNDITSLRDELFKSLRALNKGATADDIAVAKAKSDIAQTIINSVKVEIDAAKVFGGSGSAFIPADTHTVIPDEMRQTATGILTRVGAVSQHRIK